MKHFIKFIIFSVLVVAIAFFIHKFSRSYSLNIMYSDLEWVINTKGCNDARAFDFDEDNNLYIAFKDKIKIIKNDSKEVQLINNSDLNIYDIAGNKNTCKIKLKLPDREMYVNGISIKRDDLSNYMFKLN